MSRLVFGRDRIPEPWESPVKPSECLPGSHLVDSALERCTVCGWLDPAVTRCSEQSCILPAEYEAQIAAKDDPEFTKVLRSAPFCVNHMILGGVSLFPDGPRA